jgi:hypothetical protein
MQTKTTVLSLKTECFGLVWSGLVCFVGSPALCREDIFIKAYVGLHWHDVGCQAALEGACQENMRIAWTKIKENVFAHGKKIDPVDTQ